MGVVHSHTADHIGSLTCSRAAGEKVLKITFLLDTTKSWGKRKQCNIR